ncbi:MAG: hypothetical protein QN178_09045 [Armatimonadota bacterium]|nr:hypothetical protein [Armatimonadota bacterium]
MLSRILVSLVLAGAMTVGQVWAAAAPGLTVSIVSITNPATRDADASLTIRTDPGAECRATARVTRGRKGGANKAGATPGAQASPSKPGSKSLTLAAQVADARGMVTWKTRVDSQTPRGPVVVTVTCALGGRAGQAETTIEVR